MRSSPPDSSQMAPQAFGASSLAGVDGLEYGHVDLFQDPGGGVISVVAETGPEILGPFFGLMVKQSGIEIQP